MENKEYVSVESVKGGEDKLKLDIVGLMTDIKINTKFDDIKTQNIVNQFQTILSDINNIIESRLVIDGEESKYKVNIQDGQDYLIVSKFAKQLNPLLRNLKKSNYIADMQFVQSIQNIKGENNLSKILPKLQKKDDIFDKFSSVINSLKPSEPKIVSSLRQNANRYNGKSSEDILASYEHQNPLKGKTLAYAEQ